MKWVVRVLMVIQFYWMTFTISAYAQEQDSVKASTKPASKDSISLDKLDSIFSYSDSLSIFSIIDSLLNTAEVNSSVAFRAGVNSNIISAGRTIGVSQLGATAGVSYYHKTGLFLDLSSYWSEDYDPKIYLSIASAGYLKTFSKYYSVMASYDRLIYNNTDINVENPLTNMIGLSQFVDLKPVTMRLDYSFYFGSENAHRLTPGIVLNLKKYNFIGLDRIGFTPSYQILFGNATITTIQLTQSTSGKLAKRPRLQQIDTNEFGLMNHAMTLPLRITKKNWSFTLAYTYNWPVALPGETSTLPENSFTSFTLSKMVNLR
jgi:hypothetical protein